MNRSVVVEVLIEAFITVNHKPLLELSVQVAILGVRPELLEAHTALPVYIPAAPCGLVDVPFWAQAEPTHKLATKSMPSIFLILVLPVLIVERRFSP